MNYTIYESWRQMRKRCCNPQNKDYAKYGGRGITVCDRWLNSYQNFFDDMGERPSLKHSVDRIDNDGPYSPENCRWATSTEQCNNKRSNHKLTWNGVTKTITEWSRELGIDKSTILRRVSKYGMTVEQALTKNPDRRQFVDYDGKTWDLESLAKAHGLTKSILWQRLSKGQSLQTALSTPVLGNRVEYQGRSQLISEWANEFGISTGVLWNRIHRGWSVEDALTRPVAKR